ncbi:MAG TPA: potassium channel family protein [Candidatus Acidoferrales bacterium]|nr:potassium channel family protein [Candidatus Acidoferrales bacterium]
MAINAIKKDFHVFLESLRHRKYALTYLIALTFISTVLFSIIEHHTPFDSFYWTITVLSTVGFGDITPHTVFGKMVFIVDAVSGITTYIYLITSWQTSVVEARLERKLWELADADFSRQKRKTKSRLFDDDQSKSNT